MDFSEVFAQTDLFASVSPNGSYVAHVSQFKLIVRETESLQVAHIFTCLDAIQIIEWSSDSAFVLCCMKKRGLVQIWSLDEPEWSCKIDEGSAGLDAARWTPDGRHVLTTANFNLRITVWSLMDKAVSYIKYPKSCSQPMHFSADGKYLALAERRELTDCVSIFDCHSWELLKHFEPGTEDCDGVEWSPDCCTLAVWESSLSYTVCLFSLEGERLGRYSAYERALGVKSLAWSPSAQFLAVGSFDEKVRILNHVTWNPAIEYSHSNTVAAQNHLVTYREVEERTPKPGSEKFPAVYLKHQNIMSRYVVQETDVKVKSAKPDPNKANPLVGVGALGFSPDGRYLYSRNDNMPQCLWIWDMVNIRLCAVLLHTRPIKQIQWDPTQSRLALCTGNKRVYMWSPGGALVVEVPVDEEFKVQRLHWLPKGAGLLLQSTDKFSVCYLKE